MVARCSLSNLTIRGTSSSWCHAMTDRKTLLSRCDWELCWWKKAVILRATTSDMSDGRSMEALR